MSNFTIDINHSEEVDVTSVHESLTENGRNILLSQTLQNHTAVATNAVLVLQDASNTSRRNKSSENNIGILPGSITSLNQSVDAALNDTALQQCVVCKRVMKCKYNIVRENDTKHLCTEVCFKVFRCNPTIYLDVKTSSINAAMEAQNSNVPNVVPTLLNEPLQIVSSTNNAVQTVAGTIQLASKSVSTLSINRCFKCNGQVRKENASIFAITYMGGPVTFCNKKCFIAFVKANKLCASCGVYCQGLSTAEFTETPTDGSQFFCNASCRLTFCRVWGPSNNNLSSTNAIEQLKILPVVPSSGTMSSMQASQLQEPQVITIEGDDEVEIVGVTKIPDRMKTRGRAATSTSTNSLNLVKAKLIVGEQSNSEKLTGDQQTRTSPNAKKKCSVCGKANVTKHELTYNGKAHNICGDACLLAFGYANNISLISCSTCNVQFISGCSGMSVKYEGDTKNFCSTACLDSFRRLRQKTVACAWCGSKKSNFDMVERVDANNKIQLFCTLKCLSLYRVNLQAMSNQNVACDQCRRLGPAQYHLTMSDASVRNFCSYGCVMSYQSQFSTPMGAENTIHVNNSIQDVKTSIPDQLTTPTVFQKDDDIADNTIGSIIPVPVISEVVSMAPKQISIAAALGNKSPLKPRPLQSASTMPKLVQNQESLQPGVRQLVVQRPKPQTMVAKSVMCKPVTMTKATTCRPHTSPIMVQTEESGLRTNTVLIPVPVPIYVPIPVPMYTMPTPYPVPIPVPLPVPLLIPTTAKTANAVSKQIKEILETTPIDPFEADLLHMAEAVATAEKDESSNHAITCDENVKDTDMDTFSSHDNFEVDPAQHHRHGEFEPAPSKAENVASSRSYSEIKPPSICNVGSLMLGCETDNDISLCGNFENKCALDCLVVSDGSKKNEFFSEQESNSKYHFEDKPISNQPISVGIVDKAFICDSAPVSDTSPINCIDKNFTTNRFVIFDNDINAFIHENIPENNIKFNECKEENSTWGCPAASSYRGSDFTLEQESEDSLNSCAKDKLSSVYFVTFNGDINGFIRDSERANDAKSCVFEENPPNHFFSFRDDVGGLICENKNTRKQTNWAMHLFEKWRKFRNNLSCGEAISSLENMNMEQLNKNLSLFFLEIRKPDGQPYPGQTLYIIALGLLRYLREKNIDVNIFDKKDATFSQFRSVLYARMKELKAAGIGTHVKQAMPITPELEDKLWKEGLLGAHSSKALFNSVYFYNCKLFGLQSTFEHRALQCEQFELGEDEGGKYIKFSKQTSKHKEIPGRKRKLGNSSIKRYNVSITDGNRDLYFIYSTYLSAVRGGSFYRRPMLPTVGSGPLFSVQPMGINKIRSVISDMCHEAGLPGQFTNSSGKKTYAFSLKQADTGV